MTRIQLLGLSILLIVSACMHSEKATITSLQEVQEKDFNLEFQSYCRHNSGNSAERNAVIAAFAGDYRSVIDFATQAQPIFDRSNLSLGFDSLQVVGFLASLEKGINDQSLPSNQRELLKRMARALKRPTDIELIFKNASTLNAKDYISNIASNFHFVLINEAHYSSQNRQFTRELLKPLWEKGYRYLAMEALSKGDSDLQSRGYPVLATGYYIQDAVFGNVIREALTLGYKLISYEYSSLNPNLRDSMQAQSIFGQTYAQDNIGKVLVHAGYSHISEFGDNSYRPMGYQLEKLYGKDILTIDQVTMTEFRDETKVHPYYQVAVGKTLLEPSILLDFEGNPLVDPINSIGVDVQVYHPRTLFVNSRPNWLVNEGVDLFSLPNDMHKYYGCLFRIMNSGEASDAIPVDQFILSNGASAALAPGEYNFQIIDCDGAMIARGIVRCRK